MADWELDFEFWNVRVKVLIIWLSVTVVIGRSRLAKIMVKQ